MTKLKQIIKKWLCGSSQRRIAKHFTIGKTSVYRIIRNFQKYGSVKPLPSLHYTAI